MRMAYPDDAGLNDEIGLGGGFADECAYVVPLGGSPAEGSNHH